MACEINPAVPSHWEAIGVAPSDLDAFGPWLSGVYEVASAAGRIEHGHGATAVADDPSGARITIHVGDDGAIRCAKPGFAGAATFRWRPERVAPDDDCPLCDVVMADLVDDDGELVYPFALSVETIGHTRALIPFGDEGDVSFAALGETGEVWRDETAFEASHEPPGETGAPVFGGFASRSLIPSGTFVFEPGQAVTSHVLAHGVVDTVERRRNELGGGEFWAIRLETLGGTFDVCAAPGSLEHEELLAPGAVVGGTFWLVGLPLTLRPEPGPVPVLAREPATPPSRLGRLLRRRGA